MNIGQAAEAAGISAKMIRHYESIGLVKPGPRSDAGYRKYQETDLHTLRFIRRARNLGFSLDQIRDLLSLWQDKDRASKDVKAIALEHAAELDQRIRELTEMRDTLKHLASHCAGDARPDCPILQGLATEKAEKAEKVKNVEKVEKALLDSARKVRGTSGVKAGEKSTRKETAGVAEAACHAAR